MYEGITSQNTNQNAFHTKYVAGEKEKKFLCLEIDENGYVNANFDLGNNNLDMDDNEFQILKYENYIFDSYLDYLEKININDNEKLVRIYGKDYNNTVPKNFLLFDDLAITLSILCKI